MKATIKRRVLSAVTIFALLLTLFAGLPLSASALPNTVTINTQADWDNFVDGVNSGDSYAYVTVDLQTDITQSLQVPIGAYTATFGYATTGSPIVTGGNGFAGILNGNGHSVDIFILNYYSSLGLFAYLEPGGEINDLTVTGDIIERGSSDTIVVGGVVGYNCGTIDNVINEVNISAGGYSDYIGGIAGFIGSTGGINNCLVLDPAVSGASPAVVGRIAGINSVPGNLANNSAVGGTFTLAGVPITSFANDPDDTNGATASLSDPPIASDFDGTELDTDESDSAFAMSPWDYPYPVLSWQIDKGIRP
jgi:hypothetical protein